jgi:hypothetical protein
LKDLKVTKVDFVDAGANPGANILIYKNKEGAPAAEGAGKAPDTQGAKPENAFKRVLTAVAKALGIDDEKEIDETLGALAKGREAESFNDKMQEAARRRITSEIWDICYALEESLCSVIMDDELPWESKADAMKESLTQFDTAMADMIPAWSSGKTANKIVKNEQPITTARLEVAKAAKEKLEAIIAKAEKTPETDPEDTSVQDGCKDPKTKKSKGEPQDMKIDKSKLTPEELAALEAIEKKAGVQEEPPAAPAAPAETDPVEKGAKTDPAEGEQEDIYKGLHPAVKAELESLRKTADRLEDRELEEVAKKYEIIGKKAEELVPIFKNLKAAGGNAYDQMITVLDASVEAFEKSGIFNEVGKKGSGTADAWTLIEKHADEIQKSMPTLSRTQAIEKACDQHPELVAEYENQR